MTPAPTPAALPAASLDAKTGVEALFDESATYDALLVEERKRSTRDGALIRDVNFIGSRGSRVGAYLVGPADGADPKAGVLYLHWLSSARGSREEFVDEAVELASLGIVSVLPQLNFPWAEAPADVGHDRVALGYQVRDIRRAVTILEHEAQGASLAVVGHDFGGMYAAVVGVVDTRLAAGVIMCAPGAWADWFVPYFDVPDTESYRKGMRDLDPRTLLGGLGKPFLLQFAEHDEFVTPAAAEDLASVAGAMGEARSYDAGHPLNARARDDRREWLVRQLAGG